MHPVQEMCVDSLESREGYFFYKSSPSVVIVEHPDGPRQPMLQSRNGISMTVDEAIKFYNRI